MRGHSTHRRAITIAASQTQSASNRRTELMRDYVAALFTFILVISPVASRLLAG